MKGFGREDVASAVQQRLEEVVVDCIKDIPEESFNLALALALALAGGIFANVKLNQRLKELDAVNDIFVFPNMGDGGLSVGAAWLALEKKRMPPFLRLRMFIGGLSIRMT